MPVTIRRDPTANGATYTGFTASAGAKWSCVDDGYDTPNCDTDYVHVVASSAASYSVTIGGVLPSYIGVVVGVYVEAKVRKVTDNNVWGTLGVRLSGANTASSMDTITAGASYYAVQATPVALARPGGGVWSLADLNNTADYEAYITSSNNAGDKRCTQLNDRVDYEYAVGGFAGFIMSLLGPMAALALHEMPSLARHVYARTGHCIHRDSLVQYWRDWQSHKFPSYCFVGAAA